MLEKGLGSLLSEHLAGVLSGTFTDRMNGICSWRVAAARRCEAATP
jgi:hypothetical protein